MTLVDASVYILGVLKIKGVVPKDTIAGFTEKTMILSHKIIENLSKNMSIIK